MIKSVNEIKIIKTAENLDLYRVFNSRNPQFVIFETIELIENFGWESYPYFSFGLKLCYQPFQYDGQLYNFL